MHSLLVVEPDTAQGTLALNCLDQAGYQVWVVPSIEQAVELCQRETLDALIVDLAPLPPSALVTLSDCLVQSPNLCCVIYSQDDSRASLLQALQLGAADYVLKDNDAAYTRLISTLQRLSETHHRRHPSTHHQVVREVLSSIEEDLRAGRLVQRSLFPEKPFMSHGVSADYELHASMYLSGDLVDYFELQPGWFLFYILDVSGHGVASALMTILLRNEINRMRRDWHLGVDETIEHPHLVLLHLNAVLERSELGKHATLWIGLLDARLKTLSYANAGHYPYPLLQIDGQMQWLKQPNVPIGLFGQPNYETVSLNYDEQIAIALCSDGVFEAMPASSLEERETLWSTVVSQADFRVADIATTLNVTAHAEATDDMTIMMITHGEGLA
jgi:sigma-B regulation protein RsbU (phosphoserine phosphatase)